MYTRVHTCDGREDAPVDNAVVDEVLTEDVDVAPDDVPEVSPVSAEIVGRPVRVDESCEMGEPPVPVKDQAEAFVAVDATTDTLPVGNDNVGRLAVVDESVGKCPEEVVEVGNELLQRRHSLLNQ